MIPPKDSISSGLQFLASICKSEGNIAGILDPKLSPATPQDTEAMVRLAVRHSVVPQLRNAMPAGTSRELDRLYYSSQSGSIRLEHALEEALHAFVADSIRAVPFKGPVLAKYLFGDPGARSCTDLDMLVHEADLVRARSCLEKCGYRRMQELSPAAERAWRGAGWGYDMRHPETGVNVDIHSQVTPEFLPGRIDWDSFWPGLRQVESVAGSVRIPGDEELFVLLCWHGAKHSWDRLVWLRDIDALASCDGFDWEKAGAVARRWKVGRTLSLGAAMVRKVFGTVVPEQLLLRLPPDLVTHCIERLGSEETDDGTNWRREQVFYLRMRETAARRGLRLARTVFRPSVSDCEWISLPDALWCFYVLLRPFRLAAKLASGRK